MPKKAKRTESDFGHGGIPLKKDLRDRKFSELGMAPIPFNWAKGFDALKKTYPVKDQGPSSSCGGQTASYLMQNLYQKKELSAKNIYSNIFYAGGGTTLRDILKWATTSGISEEALVVSYNQGKPPTEAFMTVRDSNTPATRANALKHKGLSYAFVNPDIESYAQAIRDNGGAILQIWGQDNGTWLSAFPLPARRRVWNHFVVADGAFLIEGVKFIRIRNSWGKDCGNNGHQYIAEAHFNAGMVQTGGIIYNPAVIDDTEAKKKSDMILIIQKLISLYQQLLKQNPV